MSGLDSPRPPTPSVVDWIYSFQANGRSLATFLGDVLIDGTVQTVLGATPVFPTLQNAINAQGLGAAYSGIMTLGLQSPGDGGGALYTHVAGPVTFGGFQSSDGQWWQATPLNGWLPVLAFTGFIMDGASDCTPAIMAADARAGAGYHANLWFGWSNTGNPYIIGSNLTFTNACRFSNGAALKTLVTGLTLTIGEIIDTQKNTIFQLAPGTNLVPSPKNPVGYPEWFGSQVGQVNVDAAIAINQCILAFSVTDLAQGAWYIQTAIVMTSSYRWLRGRAATQAPTTGPGAPGTGAIAPYATQIVLRNQAGDQAGGLVLNNSSVPGPGAAGPFILFPRVSDLTIVSATPAAPLGVASPRTVQTGSFGVFVGYCINAHLDNVLAAEFELGFYVNASVECYLNNCSSLRYQPSASDRWWGFYQTGQANLGYNSGTASMYYTKCRAFSNMTVSGAPGYGGGNYAMQLINGFTDTYVVQLECGNVGWGIDVEGNGNGVVDYSSEDLIIQNCVLDGLRFGGIHITKGGPGTAIQIQGTYFGVTAATAPSPIGIFNDASGGSVVVQGCQMIGIATNSAVGIEVNACSGIGTFLSANNIFTDIFQPLIFVASSQVSSVGDRLNFVRLVPGAATGAINVQGCDTGYINSAIVSTNGLTVPIGIDFVASANAHFTVDVTQVSRAGVGQRLQANGALVSAAGNFPAGGSNLATGNFN
jgi:hypothetical protein